MKISLFSRKNGGQDSFEELVMPYINDLYRLAYHYCGQQADAEDLVQELLIKLFQRTEEMARVEKLRPWLAKSLYHLFIDRLRQQQRAPFESIEAEHLEQLHDPNSHSNSPEKLVLVANIEKAMGQLNHEQRTLIVLHDVENYTLAELELILDTPIGTLKSRLHRARARLREILSEEGTISPAVACL